MSGIYDFGLQQHKIKMDGKFFENNLIAVAGDTARRLEVQLLDSNNMIQNTTGIKLRLNAEVAGKSTFTEAELVDAAKGIYKVDLANGMLLAPGNWQFQWQITDSNDNKLHSFAFTGSVGSNIAEGGSQATNFYLNVEDLKEMQEDLVSGSFDSVALETNIEGKLIELENDYAPRLVKTEQDLNRKAEKVYVDNKIGELGATATFKGSDTNANILAKTGMSIGDEWYDKTNNQSLRWNGSSWLPVGSTIKLGPNTVTPDKLTAVNKTTSRNLLNLAGVTQGSYVANDAGEIRTGVSSYSISDYYEVEAGTTYRKTGTLFTAFFKDIGVPSIEKKAVGGLTYVIPSDAKYARSTILTADLPTAMIVKGMEWPSTYIPYSETYSFDKNVFTVTPTNVNVKKTRNLFDKSKVTFGGYYDATGTFVNVPSYGLSDYIEVTEGETVAKLTTGFSSWYDENFEWKSTWGTTRQTRVPKGVKYLRAITNTTNVDKEMVIKGYEYPTSYIPYGIETFDNSMDVIDTDKLRALTSNLYGKKWAFLGDSLSDYLFSYPHLIGPKYNMRLVHMALSGRSMAKRGEPTDTTYPPLINIYQSVPEDVDIITVWIGTNDKGSNVAIGSIDSMDETTFMGAYNVMLKWLIENRPKAKILLITPMQRSDSTGQTGTPLIDYVNAVEQLGMKYGKRVLNMYKNSGIYVYSEVVKQKFIPDGLHPNDDGHKTFIAPPIEAAMLQM